MKCKYCGDEIDKDQLWQEPQRNKDKSLKTTGTGKQLYFNYHKKCFEHKQRESAEWSSLYEYIKDKYFNQMVSTALIKDLKELRKLYTYEMMLLCYQDIESNVKYNIEKIQFDTDFQKCKYLLSCLTNNIDGFVTKIQLTKKKEQNKQIKNNIVNTANTVQGEFKVPKSKNKFLLNPDIE